MHNPKAYKYFHKQHYEWQTPLFDHPVEHFYINLVLVFLGIY